MTILKESNFLVGPGDYKVDDVSLEAKANNLELLLLDVDGVFTDGGIILAGGDLEAKKFDVKDGMGVTLAQRAGIDVGIITGRVSEVVKRRADELDINRIYQGHFWKDEALEEILDLTDLSLDEIAFIGDDVLDICVLDQVGFSFAPSDSVNPVKEHVDYITDRCGGNGAIREAVDYLLDLRDQREEIYSYYESGGV